MEAEATLPEGEGKKEVAASCGQCHRLNVVTSQRKTREQWQQTVDKMITKYHAHLEPDSSDRIVSYLSRNLGHH
jgi:mono/diheme cytochrome c family protein